MPCAPSPIGAKERGFASCFPYNKLLYITYKIFWNEMCLLNTLFWGYRLLDAGMDVLNLDGGLILGRTSQVFWTRKLMR